MEPKAGNRGKPKCKLKRAPGGRRSGSRSVPPGDSRVEAQPGSRETLEWKPKPAEAGLWGTPKGKLKQAPGDC